MADIYHDYHDYAFDTYEGYQILKQKYDQLLDDFSDLEHQMSEGRERIGVLESDLEYCQDQFNQVDSEAANLEAELTDVLGALSDAQDKIDADNLEIQSLKDQVLWYQPHYRQAMAQARAQTGMI